MIWETIKGFWTEDWHDLTLRFFNKNSLASNRVTEVRYKIWSDSEYRADRICWLVECGVRVKSGVTQWFLAWTTGRIRWDGGNDGRSKKIKSLFLDVLHLRCSFWCESGLETEEIILVPKIVLRLKMSVLGLGAQNMHPVGRCSHLHAEP